ncbi:UBX domain-containing protein 2A isoform X2 [Gymnodraco acuticeps]|uniref:UBX domain-containing protein 2A isoform X2 n=1 Tax=Gymnodraco acuticeps TaxID=8218 RepID=A0A6P8V4H1_GYMAC|nr:UBX domain-containing protein 2A isoform X2 [Gymnodraco acuticeps]
MDTVGDEKDENCEENEEGAPMRRTFSVEDLLDEVEKICYDASGTSKVEMVVRLWKDGFTVNDEEFRSYSIPKNQDFLDSIKRGELPAEWGSRAEEEELEISVEDLTEENYVPRKKAFHPFSGRGYRLGRITDVHDFVARCQRRCPPFVLTTSVPIRELGDKELSLEEADLSNAVIVQRPLDTQSPFGHS